MRLVYLFIFLGWMCVQAIALADAESALIVRWSPHSDLPRYDSLVVDGHRYRQQRLINSGDLLMTRVELNPVVPLVKSLRDFRAHPEVIYAEPDYAVSAALTPNDPELTQQWHHQVLGSTQAWDLATDCGDVIVAVIDTGIDLDHPELIQNLWVNPLEIAGNQVDDDGNGVVDDVHGYNAISNGGIPDDDNGHGSHVAGVIGAAGNNAEGVSGICWRTRLMAIKFLDRFGGGTVSNAARGIQYALDNRPPGSPMIINNSWVISTFSQALKDVLTLAESQNILVTVAAGNTGADNDQVEVFPAFLRNDLGNMISVANTTVANELYQGSDGSSNFGVTSVDLAAPGTDIYSTYKNKGYFTLTGSSMATPMVSGAAALVLQQRPNIDYAELKALVLANVSPQASLKGKLMVPGILDVGRLTQNAFVKPQIIYRTESRAGKLLQSGDIATLHGFGLDDVNNIFLDGESLPFRHVDTTRLEINLPAHAKDGVISTNVTNELFVRFELNPPDAVSFDPLTAVAGILSWNYPGNAEFVEVERASRSSGYTPLTTINTPISVLRDEAIDPGQVCYRLRSGFGFIDPRSGLAETRYSDYSQPTALEQIDQFVNWSSIALGSVSVGQPFAEQFLASSLGASFRIASVDGLPAGLSITETGFLSGQIATAGRYSFDMILLTDDSCPEQQTFNLQVLAEQGVRVLDSAFGGEYRFDASNARMTRLQSRRMLSWEPDPQRERHEIIELQIEWDDVSKASEGSLLTVLRSQLGRQDGFFVLVLNQFDEWVELGVEHGLQKFDGGFSLPLTDNDTLLDRDSDRTSARVTLLIDNGIEPVAQLAQTSDQRCFIASVIYQDDPNHPNLALLRSFRDQTLLKSAWGRALIDAYYRHSPAIAHRLEERPGLAMLIEVFIVILVFLLHFGDVLAGGAVSVIASWWWLRRQRTKRCPEPSMP